MPSALRRTFERQLKHDRLSGLSVPVWCDLAVMADIRGFADVAQHRVSGVLKQMQRLAVLLPLVSSHRRARLTTARRWSSGVEASGHCTTRTGVKRSIVVPSPSWPLALSPQQ